MVSEIKRNWKKKWKGFWTGNFSFLGCKRNINLFLSIEHIPGPAVVANAQYRYHNGLVFL
jgi:hypothetical protein